MRLLLVENLVCMPIHGGANKANQVVLEGLARLGHECRLLARSTSAQGAGERQQFLALLHEQGLAVEEGGDGVDVFTSAGVRTFGVTDVGRLCGVLREQIRSFAPDWVLVSSEDSGQTLLETALQAAPDRVVYLAHTPQMFPFGSDSFVPSEAGTALVRRAAGIIADGQRTADLVERHTGIAPTVIHPPVYGQPPFPEHGRFDQGAITLINPSAIKGLPIFAGLARRFPEAPFAALPGWSTTAADRRLLESLPNVARWKPVGDIDSVLARTRVLLVPSLYQEGFGIVTVEAMLRGIPVLASDYGGLPDAKLGVDYVLPISPILRYEAGFDDRGYPVAVVPPQDLTPWATALRALLTDPAEYARVAGASRAAATAFVAGLGIAPFEAYLQGLSTRGGAVAQPAQPADRHGRLQTLSPEQRALLARRARQRLGGEPRTQAIPVQPRMREASRFPASSGQRQLWFLSELQPDSTAYNDPVALELSGALNITALVGALQALIDRHESLRTTFALDGGELVQVVAAARKLRVDIHDVQGHPPEARRAEAQRFLSACAARPFDLTAGPLFRVDLLRLGQDQHILLLALHHIISDGWSWSVALGDLGSLYRAALAGEAADLPELRIQYADYAVWQRGWRQGEALEEQRTFWRQQLADLPTLDLPTDRPRPALLSPNGATLAWPLPAELGAALAALGQREGATLFMALLTAWKIVLARHSGQRDVVVGTSIAGRNRSELEGLVGFFANTLVLRSRLDRQATVRDVLRQVRDVALGAFAHQDLPFEDLVGLLNQPRDLSRHPLFQVMVMFQNEPLRPPALPGVDAAILPVAHATSKFDLTLRLETRPDGQWTVFEYCTDLFEAATITRLADQLHYVLAEMAIDPDRRWIHLPLLHAEQPPEWRAAQPPFSTCTCIHERFAAQAAATPGATALVYEGQRLSYAELDGQANRLAHLLIAQGVGPETLVAICMERSALLVVAILGVLKAGGAYVPVDPAYPTGRIRLILHDARPAVVLTNGGQLALAEGGPAGWRQIDLADDAALLAQQPASAPPQRALPDNLAYVIYTSGSTGRPKGSLISHANVDRLLRACEPWFGFGPQDVWTLFHSAAFDFSVWELWGALCYGGRLVVVPFLSSRAPEAFYDLLVSEGVTVLNQTPSAFQQLVAVDRGRADAQRLALRLVIFGGEALHLPSLLPWVERHGDQAPLLVNMYGITETTVHVTYRPLRRADIEGNTGSVIGVPIPDLQLHLLDGEGQAVPAGVVGGLYVGGPGLARGYLHRPDLTAERFVPNPFSAVPGERLYHSGDLARLRHGGDLEYLGRSDFQVKLRGFRIELGEIKALLKQCEGVRDAEVVLRDGANSADKRLVAYVVPEQEPKREAGDLRLEARNLTAQHGDLGGREEENSKLKTQPSELRAFLARQLPDHMVPAAFVMLHALPLTVNGKLDTRALPDPQIDRDNLATAFLPPSSDAEIVLAERWRGVLGVARVGLHDSFFDLGGNSLLATQLINHVESVFQVKVALRPFFLNPTIAGLLDELTTLWGDRATVEEIAALFREIETMPEGDIAPLLADKAAPTP
ncbi:MAG TPA: amino acid adenylation domain-containing protein [Roseiflexaceae bacterium]|nr:amino acid adenylation domain-containing protein [Roseiflexaceae bacterium]